MRVFNLIYDNNLWYKKKNIKIDKSIQYKHTKQIITDHLKTNVLYGLKKKKNT